MDSPLGPMMITIYCFYKQDLLARIKGPNYYVRYVENIFCMSVNVVEAKVFYQALNTLNLRLHVERRTMFFPFKVSYIGALETNL